MTKIEALKKTERKFTNLIDGDVRNGVSVSQIIRYYESLLSGEGNKSTYVVGNIEKSFLEEEIKEIERDISDWDPDDYCV